MAAATSRVQCCIQAIITFLSHFAALLFNSTLLDYGTLLDYATLLPSCLQLGGMGFVHYNNTAEEQLAHVLKTKSHTPGFVITPTVVGPQDPVAKLDELKAAKGYSSACVTDTGKLAGR